jgi:hypothetical protein
VKLQLLPKYSEEDTLDAAVLNGNEAIKININEVFITDFDFILNNLIKAVNVSQGYEVRESNG